MSIYIIAGRKIYSMTTELQNLQKELQPPIAVPGEPFDCKPNEFITVMVTSQTTITETHEFSQMSERGQGLTLTNVITGNAGRSVCHTWAISADHISEDLERQHHRDSCNCPTDGGCNVDNPRSSSSTPDQSPTLRTQVARNANSRMLQYARVSALFFAAMMITWIPSSANRLYTFINHDQVKMSLLAISALVLPLQGLWNALIYIVCSLDACKAMCKQIRGQRFLSGGFSRTLIHAFANNNEDEASETHELSKPPTVDLKSSERGRKRPRDPDSESIAVLKEERYASGVSGTSSPDAVSERKPSNPSIPSQPLSDPSIPSQTQHLIPGEPRYDPQRRFSSHI